MIGTGIGIPSAFAADFAAGAAGSALEQLITGGSVDAGGSILAGAQNALGQLAYGTGELTGVGNAFARGARTGAVSSALDNLADAFGIRGGGQADDPGSSYGGPQAGMTTWPGMGAGRDPRRLCGAPDPFDPWNGLGDGNTRGYQYGRNHSTGGTQESGGFSLGGFVRDTLTGAVIGGLGSAGFYGAGRAVEVLRGSVGRSRGGNKTPSEIARSWQGLGKYPGIDEYTDVTVVKGTILYRGEPNGTEYFTTLDAIEQSGRDAITIFEGLQVEKNPIHGYRSEMQGYLFNEDIVSAHGITNANPQFGKGGLPQYYVPDVQDLIRKGILTPVDNIKLYK